ncbi:unnamed protein product [Merluccius merluccius]
MCQREGSGHLLDEWLEKPLALAELDNTGGHSSTLQDQDVPGANPREDVGGPPEHEAAHDNVNVSITKMVDTPWAKSEDDSGGVTGCQDTPLESEPAKEYQDKELQELLSLAEAPFPPPPPPHLLCGSDEDCAEYPRSTLPAILIGHQQVEQLPSGQAEGGPEGHNQEAAQQVHSQGFSPLSVVAMEPANQNADGSQGFGCVVAVSEGQRRAGEQRDREACQVEEKAEQKEGGLGSDSESERLTRSSEMVRCSEIEESRNRVITEKCSSLSMPKLSGGSRMDIDPYDDGQSDSGVSADFSTISTFESPNVKANMDCVKPSANETPIEREIRRAVQREQSLRRSRGIKNVSPTTEYVEIPLKKSVLNSGLPVKSEKSQGKDRQFAGNKMQKEIHAEVQREQALVKLGTVPGVYDKGTVRQLKERKKLFEAFQEPRDSSDNLTPRTRVPSWASANDLYHRENQENASTPASPPGGLSVGKGQSAHWLNQKQQQQQQQEKEHSSTSPAWTEPGGSTSSTSPRCPGLSQGNGRQVNGRLESNLPSRSLNPPQPLQQNPRPGFLVQTQVVDVVDSGTPNALPSLGGGDYLGRTEREVEEEDTEEEPVPKENPFFKLRSSLSVDKVEQDIREAQEREKELRRLRTSLYGAMGAGTEERTRGGRGVNGGGVQLSPCPISSQSFNLPALPAQPVSQTHRSLGRLGMWPPSQAEEQQVNQLEVSMRCMSLRQKTPLLQHWETGCVINGHQDQDH